MKKSAFQVLVLSWLVAYNSTLGAQVHLNKTELIIDKKEQAFIKTIADIAVYKDYLFVVDNALHCVIQFAIKDRELKYVRTIGKRGQGPGDLEHPTEISVSENTIAVRDQSGVSFFDLDGNYKNRFRLFSRTLSFVFVNNQVYCVTPNPYEANLIEVYSMAGKRIFTFGSKDSLFSHNYRQPSMRDSAVQEMILFDCKLRSDGRSIYYISRRFGTLIKFSLSGDKLSQTDISLLYGENEKSKVKENKRLFLDNVFDIYAAKGMIPDDFIFRDFRVEEENIYLLSDLWDFLKKKFNSSMEIKALDKTRFQVAHNYGLQLEEDERPFMFFLGVRTEKKEPLFIITPSSGEQGFRVYICRPSNNEKSL
jgi:hypothetical protein